MARGSWGQSRLLTAKSWAVIRENRYLLTFPILGFLVGLVPLAIFWIPAGLYFLNDQNVLGVVLAILGIFANQIVITVSSGALVAAADTELTGGDSSIGHGLGRTLASLGPLLGWAIIATVMNVITGAIRGGGSGNATADALRNLAAAGVMAMWRLVTFLVLPLIVLDGAGPITAVRQSFAIFKDKWGTQIFGGVRIGGIVGLVTILPGILLVIAGVFLTTLGNSFALGSGLVGIVLGILLFMIGALILATMRGIFSVALFHYTKDGSAIGGFNANELADAIRTSR